MLECHRNGFILMTLVCVISDDWCVFMCTFFKGQTMRLVCGTTSILKQLHCEVIVGYHKRDLQCLPF